MMRSGGKVWRWMGAAAAVATLGFGCIDGPTQQHSQPYETFNVGDNAAGVDGMKGRFDTSAGYGDPGYVPPAEAGSGNTLTRSYVPLPEGTKVEKSEYLDETTATPSAMIGVRGSAASGVYLHEGGGVGGSGGQEWSSQSNGFSGTQPGGRNTVNPGWGTLPRLSGTGNSLMPTSPDVPFELRFGAGMWRQGEQENTSQPD